MHNRDVAEMLLVYPTRTRGIEKLRAADKPLIFLLSVVHEQSIKDTLQYEMNRLAGTDHSNGLIQMYVYFSPGVQELTCFMVNKVATT